MINASKDYVFFLNSKFDRIIDLQRKRIVASSMDCIKENRVLVCWAKDAAFKNWKLNWIQTNLKKKRNHHSCKYFISSISQQTLLRAILIVYLWTLIAIILLTAVVVWSVEISWKCFLLVFFAILHSQCKEIWEKHYIDLKNARTCFSIT